MTSIPPSPSPAGGPTANTGAASRSPWRMTWDQTWAAAFGLPALLCLVPGNGREPWGVLLGLVSQAGWLVGTWRARQQGFFVVGLAYTLVWAQGVWRYWL